MRNKSEMLSSLREAVAAVGGNVSPNWLSTNSKPFPYMVNIPCPGKCEKDFEVRKTIGTLTITSVRNPFDGAVNVHVDDFDDEFLTVEGWTVRHGVFSMAIRFEVPEKYRVVEKFLSMDPEAFAVKYAKDAGNIYV